MIEKPKATFPDLEGLGNDELTYPIPYELRDLYPRSFAKSREESLLLAYLEDMRNDTFTVIGLEGTDIEDVCQIFAERYALVLYAVYKLALAAEECEVEDD